MPYLKRGREILWWSSAPQTSPSLFMLATYALPYLEILLPTYKKRLVPFLNKNDPLDFTMEQMVLCCNVAISGSCPLERHCAKQGVLGDLFLALGSSFKKAHMVPFLLNIKSHFEFSGASLVWHRLNVM